MIDLNLTFNYQNFNANFTLKVEKGERLALIGKSGSGKSTLLNLIAGFELPNSGFINYSVQNYKNPVAMLFQDHNLFDHLTAFENIALALAPNLRLNSLQKEKIHQISKQMAIDLILQNKANELSGGQKQRVALARTLLLQRPILLLDEPFSALDAEITTELESLVKNLCIMHNLTMLMATHKTQNLDQIFTRVVTIENGIIIQDHKF